MNGNIKNHDFGYGSNLNENFEGQINKLKLRNKADIIGYLKELIESQIINAKVNGTKIIKDGFPKVKIHIKKLKD